MVSTIFSFDSAYSLLTMLNFRTLSNPKSHKQFKFDVNFYAPTYDRYNSKTFQMYIEKEEPVDQDLPRSDGSAIASDRNLISIDL